MTLNLRCQAQDFARFKSGDYRAILVEGKGELWKDATPVNLGEAVIIENCNSPRKLPFEISEVIRYSGASTLDTALSDLRARLGTRADAHDSLPVYQAPNGREGLVPLLYHEIYAIIIRPYKRKSRARW